MSQIVHVVAVLVWGAALSVVAAAGGLAALALFGRLGCGAEKRGGVVPSFEGTDEEQQMGYIA